MENSNKPAKDFSVRKSPDKLVIQIPMEAFDDLLLDNLHKLVASKAGLIQKALGLEQFA